MKGGLNDIKCRHCLRLYAGACPHPVARSAHRMRIKFVLCKVAVMHPRFEKFYKGGGEAHSRGENGRRGIAESTARPERITREKREEKGNAVS